MHFQKSQITIETDIKENRKKASMLHLMVKFIVAAALFLSFGSLLYRTLSLEQIQVSVPLMLIIAAEIMLMTLIYQERMKKENKYGFLYPLLILLVIVAVCLVFMRQFTNGLCSYLNQGAYVMMEATGSIYRGYETEGDPLIGVQIFSAIVTAIIAYFCTCAVGDGKLSAVVILPMPVLAGVVFGIVAVDVWLVIFMAAIAVMVSYKAILSAENRTKYRAVLPVLGISIAAALLVSGAIYGTGISGIADCTSVKETLQHFLHEKRYEDGGNPLPEGNLKNLGEYDPSNRISLQLTMGTPESVYLRGFVGERYDGSRWSSLDGETLAKEGDLFFWLHERGFYGQSQLGDAYGKIQQSEEDYMSVFMVSGCRRYFYTPYGLNQSSMSVTDSRMIGDANILSKDSDASEDYIINYTPQAVKKSYTLQEGLKAAESASDRELQDYLDNEEAYRKTAYDNYLSLPKETEAILKKALGEKEELSTTEAKIRILNYLNENVLYKEKLKVGRGEDGDFLGYFLNKSRCGYCVHYATAAAAMLRYYGIPARYVEGYIVTSEDVKDVEAGEPVSVFEDRSHAWAEYYLDGVGWLPFETVPKYLDENMYEQTGNHSLSGIGSSSEAAVSGGKEEDEAKDETGKQNDDPENPLNSISSVFVFKIVFVLAFILLIILVLLLITFLRRRRLARFTETFTGDDLKMAVENALAYTSGFFRRKRMAFDNSFPRNAKEHIAGWLGEQAKETYLSCLAINEKSRFSRHLVTEEERRQVIAFKDFVLDAYRAERKGFLKIYDKYIKCVY